MDIIALNNLNKLAKQQQSIIPGTGLSGSGDTLSINFGTSSGTVCEGNDSRLASDRTRKITVSTSNPSAGTDGDVWMKY